MCKEEAGKEVIWKRLLLNRAKPLARNSYENITQALNELKHEVLSHQAFLSCFSSALGEEKSKV
ncbi:MAG: hypothetical protein AUF79_09940 [Crenarchaeota archaeon 13_1_20CM_2_51_8]|nr:MAG: hypothetical protein AUF79_09940 [Crenarchaeota archaeon 13_1_20CM_2_51_8]